MSKNYTAQLAMQASVPEDPSLQQHIKYSIEFDVLCPVSGCKTIKRNGPDYSHTDHTIKFYCHRHARSFYAHTSWVIRSLAEIIVVRIILQLFTSRVSERYIAEQYHLSQSTISTLVNSYSGFVKSRISQIRNDMERVKQWHCNTVENQVIWLDETFFKIAKKSWALIMAINVRGEVVGWKLSRTRTSKDISEVLTMVDAAMPDIRYIIGDGARSYPSAVLRRKRDGYLIQHMHSHPWQDVRINHYEVLPNKSVTQSVVEVNYNSLYSNQLQVGYAVEKYHKPPSNRKRGRPKGSKNKKKSKQLPKPKEPKRRGPKTPRSSGEAFVFQTNTATADQFLKVRWLEKDIKIDHSSKDNPPVPSLLTIQSMLWTVFCLFTGKAIVSNRIESKNAQIKNIMPERGMRSEKNLRSRVEPFVMLHAVQNCEAPATLDLPISPRLGLMNLGRFMSPDTENIVILARTGGDY